MRGANEGLAGTVLVLLRVVKAGPEYVIQKSPLFVVLLLMSMLERLSAFAADVAIERDYVPQLAGAYATSPESMWLQ